MPLGEGTVGDALGGSMGVGATALGLGGRGAGKGGDVSGAGMGDEGPPATDRAGEADGPQRPHVRRQKPPSSIQPWLHLPQA